MGKKWDRNVKSDELENVLLKDYRDTIAKIKETIDRPRKRKKIMPHNLLVKATYLAIALTQLYNCSRRSEAIDAINEYMKTGHSQHEIRIRKQKKGVDLSDESVVKKMRKRVAVVPTKIIDQRYLTSVDPDAYTQYIADHYNVVDGKVIKCKPKQRIGEPLNTHTLRYAGVELIAKEMSSRGYPMEYVKEITGHSDLKTLQRYMRERTARDVFVSILKSKGVA